MLVSELSCAKGFIKFKQVVFAHTLDNQRVLISVLSVSSYILVLRLVLYKPRYLELAKYLRTAKSYVIYNKPLLWH